MLYLPREGGRYVGQTVAQPILQACGSAVSPSRPTGDANRGRWVRVALLPFMAYVMVVLPLALLIPAVDTSPYSLHRNNSNLGIVYFSYLACFCALLIGGVVQVFYRRKQEGVITFAFAALAYAIFAHPWFYL